MGNNNSGTVTKTLSEVRGRASGDIGKLSVTGRYHVLPRKLDDDYLLQSEVLGKGFNGEVVVAKHRITQQKVAVKPFMLRGADADKLLELSTEVEIFLNMDHPHVARLVDIYESGDCLHLVMECMEGGEVFQRVLAQKKFTSAAASVSVRQMLLALNYIHQRHIAHRDIKLENFLYESKTGDHLKLIDFGFSKVWDENTRMKVSCGTVTYVAPEVLKKSYTIQCDMWSMGVVTFILLAGYMPFSGTEKNIIQDIRACKINWKEEVWGKVEPDAREFVEKLLVVDPARRLSAAKALEHPWIKTHFEDPTAGHSYDEETILAMQRFADATKFQKAVFQVMAWSLTAAERENLRDIFLAIDKDNSGTITLSELKDALGNQPAMSAESVKPIFDALGSAHSDEVHYSDFLAAMCASRVDLHSDLLHETFRRFDTDGSGQITISEMKEVIGDSLDGAAIDSVLKAVDTSGDGNIDYKEFVAYLKSDTVNDEHLESVSKVIDRVKTISLSQKGASKETSCCPCFAFMSK